MNDRPEQKLEPGHRLDRYELLCPIAQGGMASVWLARQHGKHGFEKLVAVKTILPLYANDLRFQKMFLDEARIASCISHANVAQILDLGEEDDVLYLAMEWVDGDSVSKLFRAAEKAGERLPIGVVCRILADTCAGLHAAHELHDKNGELLNVVHRDVSPQNILVSTKGQAKLIDFGIAKARDRVAGDTSTGLLKGKILYMPPEQAMGRTVDRRADVWAIGAVLYHLLAGVPPFEGSNQLATLHMLTTDASPPPLPGHVPPEVAAIVARTLVKDPSGRVGTAEELQRMFETAMVASGNVTLQSDVAMFVNRMLADRAMARRKAMDLALEAAEHRQELREMMKPADPDSASGMGRPLGTRAAEPPVVTIPTSDLVADMPSSATLGSGAVVAPRESLRAPRAKRLAIVGGVVVACALVTAMAAGVAIARKGRSAAGAAAGAGGASVGTPSAVVQPETPVTTAAATPPEATPTSRAATAPSAPETVPPPPASSEAPVHTPPATPQILRHTHAVEHHASPAPQVRHRATSSKPSTSVKTIDDGF